MNFFELEGGAVRWVHGLRGSAAMFQLASLNRKAVVVAADERRAAVLADQYRTFQPQARVWVFPALEGSPLAFSQIHPSTRRARLRAFQAIRSDEWDVIITVPRVFIEALPPRDRLIEPQLNLRTGSRYDLSELAMCLTAMGYLAVDMVAQPGDFARRGGILDIYSFATEDALRLEFFDDELEEIRVFDPTTQRGTGHLTAVSVLPMFEWIVGAAESATFNRKGGSLWNQTAARQQFLGLVAEIRDRGRFSGYLHWTALFFEEIRHFGELFDSGTVFWIDDWDAAQEVQQEYTAHLEQQWDASLTSDHLHVPLAVFFGLGNLARTAIPAGAEVFHHRHLKLDQVDLDFATQTIPQYQNDHRRFLEQWEPQARRQAIVVVFRTAGLLQRFEDLIEEDGFFARRASFPFEPSPAPGFYLTLGHLDTGFSWPEQGIVVVSEADVWTAAGQSRPVKRGKIMFQSEFRDLKIGDYVVHQEQGVGRFLGLVEMEAGGGVHEMMAIEYRENQKLYVPLHQLDLVQRHGSADMQVSMDRMGGLTWAKTKTRVKKAIRKIAGELLQLYAARSLSKSHVYGPDTEWQREFEDAFEFEPTEGQLAAIADIKRDLEADKIMDRLLVGDVGFGKTEVAMRMAFKVVMEGFQVAILCPTTVLAFQHYHTFKARFAAFPVKIQWISRFTPPGHIKQCLADLTAGKIDLVIGTHRLLSRDVNFTRLGALIIDEEQRFGVSHKERLKQLRRQVDVLSMSATPIPRTLNMSLAGIRDLSIIETPPRNRLAISTTVAESRESLIKNAIAFEVQRGGQVFFIHNRVETMETVTANLTMLVPGIRIGMAHGQMEADLIEQAMLDFMEHRTDVLVASTIIENGVDIPNANTMIVNRSDMFGMSQLYQLRGRIGRSDRPAYAYLLVPPRARMTALARKRLAALEEFSDLGAGFRVAALDMELRGAGNMLGGEQAGHIHSIGYEMFIKMLEEAVADLKGKPLEEEIHCLVNLHFGSAIPRNYIENGNQRLHYYKRLALAADEETLAELGATVADCYGPLPEIVERLLEEHRLRLFLAERKIMQVDREKDRVRLRFHPSAEVDADVVLAWIRCGRDLKVSPDGTVSLGIECRDPREVIESIRMSAAALAGR